MLVTQYGIAVNPSRPDLKIALEQAGLPLSDIHALRHKAVAINGPARPYARRSDQVVARVLGRDKKVQDVIYAVE